MQENNISLILSKKDFSIKNTGLTYRTVNNWNEKGLLKHLRETDGKWHRLTLMELVEVCVYKELKALGFSIRKMSFVKDAFYKKSQGKTKAAKLERAGENYFTANILANLSKKGGQYLLISQSGEYVLFADGTAQLEKEVRENANFRDSNSFTTLNMQNIIKGLRLEDELAQISERILTILRQVQKHNENEKNKIN